MATKHESAYHRAHRLLLQIDALENAAAMIASHGEEGSMHQPTQKLQDAYVIEARKLARSLNARANRIRKKCGLEPNGYNYK